MPLASHQIRHIRPRNILKLCSVICVTIIIMCVICTLVPVHNIHILYRSLSGHTICKCYIELCISSQLHLYVSIHNTNVLQSTLVSVHNISQLACLPIGRRTRNKSDCGKVPVDYRLICRPMSTKVTCLLEINQ